MQEQPARRWTQIHRFLDLEDPDCELMLTRVDLSRLNFSKKLKPDRRDAFEGAIALFGRWLEVEGWPPLSEIDDAQLPQAAEQWLAWLVIKTPDDHPLIRKGPSKEFQRGYRKNTEGVKSIGLHRQALNWWAEEHGRPSPLTSRARLITPPRASEPPRPARALKDEEIVAAVEALDTRAVAEIKDEVRSRLWHAREKAAFLVSLFGALRVSERGKLKDSQVVGVTAAGVSLRMLATKHHPEGRVITLQPREDILCPVRALTEFMTQCQDLGLDRGGLLLPQVGIRRSPIRTPSVQTEWKNWKRVAAQIGIDQDPEVLEGRFSIGTHGIRATVLTMAVAKRWDPEDLMRIGGWSSLKVAVSYDRSHGLDWEMAEEMSL